MKLTEIQSSKCGSVNEESTQERHRKVVTDEIEDPRKATCNIERMTRETESSTRYLSATS